MTLRGGESASQTIWEVSNRVKKRNEQPRHEFVSNCVPVIIFNPFYAMQNKKSTMGHGRILWNVLGECIKSCKGAFITAILCVCHLVFPQFTFLHWISFNIRLFFCCPSVLSRNSLSEEKGAVGGKQNRLWRGSASQVWPYRTARREECVSVCPLFGTEVGPRRGGQDCFLTGHVPKVDCGHVSSAGLHELM